ncbi:hypothetical protein AQV86_04705 [Nanohaloarchaea archaeon SG9]|nr:hypothetical protein AQV86_04705 [Nanohaloarchaea archaeon SG9]
MAEFTMMMVESVFGFVGAVMFLAMAYYTRKALTHFRDHRDVSLVKFFIDERGEKAFILLSVTALVYAVAMMVTGLEFILDNVVLLVASRALILGVAGMLLYFLREIFLITKKNPDEK